MVIEEEQLKIRIFNLYSKYKGETSSDRRQVIFSQANKLVWQWCEEYLYSKKINPFGGKEAHLYFKEIDETIKAVYKYGGKFINEENEFLSYLRTSLQNAKNLYFREYEGEIIHIPEYKKRIFNEIKKIIETEKSTLGRELTNNEEMEYVSFALGITKEKAQKYLQERTMTNINSLESIAGSDEKANDPKDILAHKLNRTKNIMYLKEALIITFEKCYKSTRLLFKSLLTVNCLECFDYLDKSNFKLLEEFIDVEILTEYRINGKRPHDYEIYLRYHPGVTKESASARASENWGNFRTRLKAALIAKNVVFFPLNH